MFHLEPQIGEVRLVVASELNRLDFAKAATDFDDLVSPLAIDLVVPELELHELVLERVFLLLHEVDLTLAASERSDGAQLIFFRVDEVDGVLSCAQQPNLITGCVDGADLVAIVTNEHVVF